MRVQTPLLHRLSRWAERRLPALTRYRQPEILPVALHRRRIYLMPTGFGIGFAVLLLVMLIGALNYANNAALLLTCLIGAASAASMLMAFRALDGLRLVGIRADHVTAGETAKLSFEFQTQRARQALRLNMAQDSTTFSIETNGNAIVTLSLATSRRGWQPLPRLHLWSTWPLGMFRAWSWLYPQHAVLVWPQPEANGPPPHLPDADVQRHRLRHGEDLAALRDYRHGDPPRHIAWKASARHEHLLVKDFERPASRREWRLDWQQLGGLEHERKIARLARWLSEARAQGRSWSLHLPGQQTAAGSGPLHYAHCMDLLAIWP